MTHHTPPISDSGLAARLRSAPPIDLAIGAGVVAVVLYGFLVLAAQAADAVMPTDISVHEAMVDWATGRFAAGRIPLDGWFPTLALGASRFHRYHSLPHVIVGALQYATGGQSLTTVASYVLTAMWPASVYVGGRLFGLDHRTAGAAAIIAPLLGSSTNRGFEWNATFGLGLWSQAWGMLLLPLAWGASRRAVVRGRGVVTASLLLGATVASHLLVGYLAMAVVPLWVLASPRAWRRRAPRALLVWVGGLASVAWFLLPLLADRASMPYAEKYAGLEQYDSIGWSALGELASGLTFDPALAVPIVTLLVAWGIGRAALGATGEAQGVGTMDERARALLLAFGASLLLFIGRPVLGPLLVLVPGSQDLFLNRFVFGLHLAGLYLAGEAVASVLRSRGPSDGGMLPAPFGRALAIGGVVVAIAVAFPRTVEFADSGARYVEARAAAVEALDPDLDRLVADIEAAGPGRVFAGFKPEAVEEYAMGDRASAGWPDLPGIGPAMPLLMDRGLDIVGLPRPAWSLMSSSEPYLDEREVSHLRMFGIRYLVTSSAAEPRVAATELSTGGGLTVWEVDGVDGYLQVVQTDGAPIVTDRRTVGADTRAFLTSPELAAGVYRVLAFGGDAAAPVTGVEAGFEGAVVSSDADPDAGAFTGVIEASADAAVVLSASYDPRWTATVDGRPAETYPVAPALVAVSVPAGRHEVSFRYDPVGGYAVRVLGGIAVLVAVALVWRRREGDAEDVEDVGVAEASKTSSGKSVRRATGPGSEDRRSQGPGSEEARTTATKPRTPPSSRRRRRKRR